MHVTMFTNTYLPHVGGVARSVNSYEIELRRRNHIVNIVAPEFDGAETSTENVLRVPAIQNFNGSDFSVRIAQPWTISDFLENDHPDIIHSHHPFLLGDAALRAAADFGTPIVFTYHTMYERYTHYVPLDSLAMQRVAIQMATEYCNLCNAVIAPSESIRDLLERRGVETPITVIPTGIDLDFFASGRSADFRKRWGIAENRRVVGHLGRLAEEKNLIYLAHAVGHFLANHRDAVFLVVGDGDGREPMKEVLLQYASPDQLVCVEVPLSGQDLVDAYAAMDCFAFSSKSETQGLVVAEAMAARTPVVALDAPGVREVVNGENGRLLSAGASHVEFSETIQAIMGNADRLTRMSETAQRSVESFGMSHCADRLCGLYTRLTEEAAATGAADLNDWDHFLARIETEWNLVVEKATALSAALMDTQATDAELM